MKPNKKKDEEIKAALVHGDYRIIGEYVKCSKQYVGKVLSKHIEDKLHIREVAQKIIDYRKMMDQDIKEMLKKLNKK